MTLSSALSDAGPLGDDDPRPLIAHVLYRFDVGGLENGVVNLINRLPRERYRHVVIALTAVTAFRHRVQRDDVAYFALDKSPGSGLRLAPRFVRLFRQLRPAIVHTRNLAALEASLPAWWARVPARVHSEHGWDVGDLDGTDWKNRWTRRLYRPFVSHQIALSKHLAGYLDRQIGVHGARVSQIYNGVDTERFSPKQETRLIPVGCPFDLQGSVPIVVIGTVGRLQAVKDQLTLARAFVQLVTHDAKARATARLVVVGSGPLLAPIQTLLRDAGVLDLVWLAGERDDIAELLRSFDVFALSSLAEGISNTILEAMATGLPVVATDVGGNRELVEEGHTGRLVPANNPTAMATALLDYVHNLALARKHGEHGRTQVLARFSLDRMVAEYAAVYERLLIPDAAHMAVSERRSTTMHASLPPAPNAQGDS